MGGRLSKVALPWETPRLILRTAMLGDAAALAKVGNHREVARGTFVPLPFTEAQARARIRMRTEAGRKGNSLELLLTLKTTGEIAGVVGLALALPPHDGGTIFYWMHPRYWGHGYMTEAVEAMLALGFGPVGLHRITATVLTYNRRSIRLLEGEGFRREGRARQVRKDRGTWIDELLYGLLDSEYLRAHH